MANRELRVTIVGDARQLHRSFAAASKSAKGFSVGLGTLAKGALVFGGISAAVAGVTAAVRTGASEFSDAATAAAQTAAALKSTGGVANVTAAQVEKLAGSIQSLSGIDDEAIQGAENLLLTFKNVRNEIGKGNQVFDRATKAAVDLSVAGFGSLDSTAKQLGKALNDPVRGMTALGRAGVTFTKQQREQIKALVETGRTLQAQKLILREVESQVGGSARAFGQTLPGQLARAREALKNTFGDLVGLVAPAVAGALGQFNDFVDDLGKARTVRAKLDVVLDRVQGLATGLATRIGDAVADIDWDAIWERARGIADGLQARLEKTDFSAIGERIGTAIADSVDKALPAVKELAERITQAVRTIDWEEIGKAAGPGLAAAIATAFLTLTDPAFWARNWELALAVGLTAFGGAIGRFVGRLGGLFVIAVSRALSRISPALGEAFRGAAIQAVRFFGVGLAQLGRVLAPLERLVGRVFGRLGRIARFTLRVVGITAAIDAIVDFGRRVGRIFASIGRSIRDAVERAFAFIKRRAIEAALDVLEPFTHLPSFFGSKFRQAKEALQEQLRQMEFAADGTAKRIQQSIDKIEGRRIQIVIDTVVNAPGGGARPEEGAAAASVSARNQQVAAEAAKAGDAFALASKLVQDAMAKASSAATAAAAAREKAAAAAKKAAARAKAATERQREAFAAMLEGLDLKADIARAKAGFKDDLAVLAEREKAIRAQIRIEGHTTALERELFNIRQERLQIRQQQRQQERAARDARQFRTLGLGPEGQDLPPTIAALKKQAASIGDAVKGTFLDTPKTKGILARIRKALKDGVKGMSEDVRAAIAQMLANLNQQLNDGAQDKGPITKFHKQSANKLLEGLGLSPEQIKELRARLSRVGVGGTTPSSGQSAFGFAVGGPGPGAVAVSASPAPVVIPITLKIDGETVARITHKHNQKASGRTATTRTGRFAGV